MPCVHRDHLLRSLTPLYLGRTAAFVLATATASAAASQAAARTPSARRSSDRSRISWNTGGKSVRIGAMLDPSDLAPHRRHRERRARRGRRALPRQARGGDGPGGERRHLQGRPRGARARSSSIGARTRRGLARDADAPRGQRPLGRRLHARPTTRATSTRSRRWPTPFRSWLADFAKRVDAGQDVASELKEGAALVRGRRRPRRRRRRHRAHRVGRPRTTSAPGQAGGGRVAQDPALAALMDRHLDRADATWSEREYELVVDRERARFAAWYEFFPRSGVAGRHGTFRRRREPARARGGHGLRRRLPAAHPPDRPRAPQGAQQRAHRPAGRAGEPVGHRRRRGRARRRPSRAGHAGRLRSVRGAGAARWDSRSRWTSPSSARPIIPGCASIPSGSSTGPTARSSTPRTRRRSTRTSIR